MSDNLRFIGFYKRKKPVAEFILYEDNGVKRLTNGMVVHEAFPSRMMDLRPVEQIDASLFLTCARYYFPNTPLERMIREATREQLAT